MESGRSQGHWCDLLVQIVVQIALDLSQVISPLEETLRIAEPTFWGWAQVSLAS